MSKSSNPFEEVTLSVFVARTPRSSAAGKEPLVEVWSLLLGGPEGAGLLMARAEWHFQLLVHEGPR